MNEIEKQLRDAYAESQKRGRTGAVFAEPLIRKAADEIARTSAAFKILDTTNAVATIVVLQHQLAEAIRLLKPFAECVRVNDRRGDGVLVEVDPVDLRKVMVVALGDLRRIRKFVERVGK